MRRGFAAFRWLVAAMGVFAAISVATPSAASECRVRLSDVQLEYYQSGGRQMHRVVLIGDHNYSPGTNRGQAATTEFRLVDSDGFLVFALLTTRWSAGDLNAPVDRSRITRVPRAKLQTLRRAVVMGQAYYARGLEIISTEPRPTNFEAMHPRIVAKQQLQSEILTVLDQASDYRASDDTVAVDLGWLRRQLARFHGEILSHSRDYRIGAGTAVGLCRPDAPNPVVGRLACAGAPYEGAPAPCPDGLVIDPLVMPVPG